ncbi:nucleoporin Nup37-like [Ylistrum balloti]|uniref:nucleoporin Nup37-like n=1 Tax=Ylistrum balloti TaxID=509963 RepID=UPI002905CBCF|nr:nucleoporin Nup37-like [Ylistrum balloti]
MSENSASFTIPCHDIVSVVEFVPFEWCTNLLAVGTNSRVTIYRVDLRDESEDEKPFEFKQVRDFQNGCRVTAISWSPETSYESREVADCLRFAVAGSNNRIQLFESDLREKDAVELLEGHTDFINSVAYNPQSGETLASTGDDLTCKLWVGDELNASFQLGAPGMSVCIHEKEPGKVMVAQKDGIIKIFSMDLQLQIMSLDCCQSPLMGADWSRLDDDVIAAVAGTEWLIFHLSRSSQPQERRQAHPEGARDIRWAKSTPILLATTGRPGRQIKVFSTRHHQVPLSTSQQVAYGMSWHYTHPLLAVGGDQQVKVYHIEPNRAQLG